DEKTFVLEVGKTEWMTLGTLLGGEEPEAAPPVASLGVQVASYTPIAPVMFHDVLPNGPNSTAPVAADIDDDVPESFNRSRKRPSAPAPRTASPPAGAAAFVSPPGAPAAAPEAAAPIAAAAPPPPAPAAPAPVAADQPAESQQQVAARLSHDQLLKLA